MVHESGAPERRCANCGPRASFTKALKRLAWSEHRGMEHRVSVMARNSGCPWKQALRRLRLLTPS